MEFHIKYLYSMECISFIIMNNGSMIQTAPSHNLRLKIKIALNFRIDCHRRLRCLLQTWRSTLKS